MDMIQKQVKLMRDASFNSSDQITLGQLIKKLKDCEDDDGKSIVRFQFELVPCGVSSWRGAYDELAIEYAYGEYGHEPEDMLLSDFILMLEGAVGRQFTGWKGGDFIMSEDTPVWASNSGQCPNTAIVDVVDRGYGYIYIQTKHIEY